MQVIVTVAAVVRVGVVVAHARARPWAAATAAIPAERSCRVGWLAKQRHGSCPATVAIQATAAHCSASVEEARQGRGGTCIRNEGDKNNYHHDGCRRCIIIGWKRGSSILTTATPTTANTTATTTATIVTTTPTRLFTSSDN